MDIPQYDIYISYTSELKQDLIDALVDILSRKHNYSVVFDHSLHAYDERFLKKLLVHSKLVLCLINEQYFKDKTCLIECSTALNVGLPVLLVLVEKVNLKNAISRDKLLYSKMISLKTINLYKDARLFDSSGIYFIKLLDQISSYLIDKRSFNQAFENGLFKGATLNGKMNGFGTLKFNCGSYYIGEFKANKFHGHGIFIHANGDLYDGDFLCGLKQGMGKFYFSNGERYAGEFMSDKLNGYGTYYFKSGDKYDGQWKNSKKNGKGMYYYANGDYFDGSFKNDLKHGKGTYNFSNGEKYVGEWLFDKKNDKGLFIYSTSMPTPEPVIVDSLQYGKVTLFYKNNHVNSGKWNKDTFKF